MGNIDRQGKCFIWGTLAEIKDHPQKQGISIVDSPRAGGKYSLSNFLPVLDDKKKAHLTSWLVKQRLLGVECPEVDVETIHDENYGQDLSINERANRLLKLIKLKSPAMGQLLNFYTENSNPDYHTTYQEMLAWSESTDASEVRSLLSHLQEYGWIKTSNNTSGGTVIMNAAGYAHLEETKKTNSSLQAFVAMWFHPSMSEMYEKGIKPAITDSGYHPYKVDEDEYVDRVDDKIIAEIKHSRFVVADFTHGNEGARGGVYYEAGFAHGLGIPVIFTCREDLINKVHFDTRQYNHIVWNSAEDLRNKLASRISVVTGEEPIKRNI